MKKKSVNLVFLFLLLAVGCSQETVMNGSISEKTNASDTKMSINIVTETSRTVRPAVTKWEITVTNKEEENNLEYSKTVDSKTTSVTFINIVATATYTVEVHGLDEDGNKILSGAKEKVQVEANKVNICNVTVSDDFEADKSDKNGTLSVNINGLGGLGIQENSNFTLKMSGSTNSNNYKNVELTYENGVLSGLESDILPDSYKISIADFPVNVIQDPIVNIYPGAVTTIDWTWNYNDEESQKQVGDNIKQKNTLIPVWNKNADGGDSVGLIGANGLFVTPTWENGTFVACDVDTAGDMWTLTITETAITEDNNQINTYKLTNEHTEESYYFKYSLEGDNGLGQTYKRQLVDFCVAEINLEDFAITDDSYKELYIENISKLKESGEDIEKMKFLFLLEDSGEIYTKGFTEMDKDAPTGILDSTLWNLSTYINIKTKLSAIEVAYEDSGLYLYLAGTRNNDSNDSSYYYWHQNIYKLKLKSLAPKSNSEANNIDWAFEYELVCNSTESENSYSYSTPILTLDIGDYFLDSATGNSIKFFNNAFKISDMHVVGDDLYITAGCVSYNSNPTNNHQYFSYSFGGLFRYSGISENYIDENNTIYTKYNFDTETNKATNSRLEHFYGLKKIDNLVFESEDTGNFSKECWMVKEKSGMEDYIGNTLIGLTQAESDDSSYFAGPRYIIPSDDKLFIIDSGFYGEYEIITDSGDTATTETVIFSLKDKRNRIFTFDGNTLSAPIKLSDSISFDYDYITRTDPFESDGYDGGTKETVSW